MEWWKVIWFPQNIPRKAFVLWLASKEKLITQDKLSKCYPNKSWKCPLCLKVEDSHKHLFFYCNYSSTMWIEVQKMMNERGLNNLNECKHKLAYLPCKNSIWSIVRRLCIADVVYHIWMERNSRIFNQMSMSSSNTTQSIINSVRNRLSTLKVKHTAAVVEVESKWGINLKKVGLLDKAWLSCSSMVSCPVCCVILRLKASLRGKRKLREGLFHVDIRRPSLGVKLLEGALHDLQSELLLLRSCMGIAKLFFSLRTCQSVHMEETTLFFDKGLSGSIENIMVCGGPLFGDFYLEGPILGATRPHILRDNDICGMDDDYVSVLTCLCDTILSFDFRGFTYKDTVPSKAQQRMANVIFSEMNILLAIIIDGLGQHMSLVEYRTILKHRLMIPLFTVDVICPVCRKACLDSFGEHAVHYKELSGFKYQHDMVRGVFFDICKRAGISAKKESHVNFLTDPLDGRSTLRPADVLVFGWLEGNMRTWI
uniref:Reverse transcriptase zinc-binding domain-containing protein n=1 Tax=Tanacetum cinerariifolium TaxID=118510 RepID=A0A699I035_TANCI|nr:hypothetical protein [Tanacetum cinerariifolium]